MVGSGAASELLHGGAASMEVLCKAGKDLPLFPEYGRLWRPYKEAHMVILRTLGYVSSFKFPFRPAQETDPPKCTSFPLKLNDSRKTPLFGDFVEFIFSVWASPIKAENCKFPQLSFHRAKTICI